jgi:hypothetical protein
MLPSVAGWSCRRLELLLRHAARPAEKKQCEGEADPGEDRDRPERRLEPFGQRDQSVGAGIRRQVVLCAGDGHGRDDRDPERGADLEARVAEPGGNPRLSLGDAGEGGDRGGADARLSGARWRDSISTNAASSAAAEASSTIVRGSPQPLFGASTIA